MVFEERRDIIEARAQCDECNEILVGWSSGSIGRVTRAQRAIDRVEGVDEAALKSSNRSYLQRRERLLLLLGAALVEAVPLAPLVQTIDVCPYDLLLRLRFREREFEGLGETTM